MKTNIIQIGKVTFIALAINVQTCYVEYTIGNNWCDIDVLATLKDMGVINGWERGWQTNTFRVYGSF